MPKYEYRERWARREITTRPGLEAYERFERLSIEILRTKFLQAMNELEPRVLQQLSNLSEAWESGHGRYKALSDWARMWRLYDNWCIERAIRTIEHWQDHPPKALLDWYFPEITVPFVIEPFRAELGLFQYDPTVDDPAELMRKFDSQVKAARKRLRAYIGDAHSKAKMAELIKVPQKRRAYSGGFATDPENLCVLHFKWLAGFHVRGWSYERIADASDRKSNRTVAFAVKALASRIGLTLRDYADYDPTQDIGTIRKALRIPSANIHNAT